MTVPPRFFEHDPYAWWRAEEARRRETVAAMRNEALVRQQAEAAAIGVSRAASTAQKRHEELLAAVKANAPRPGFFDTISPALMAVAGIAAYRGWKRRPSEVLLAYRRP